MTEMDQKAWEEVINGDIEWLEKQPIDKNSLEYKHVLDCMNWLCKKLSSPHVKFDREILKAIDDEPEYPGEMPKDMKAYVLKAIECGDVDLLEEALRATVRLTKRGIRDRVVALMKEQKVSE